MNVMMEKCLSTQTHNPDYEAISMCSSLLMMEKCLSNQTHNPDYEAISMCSSVLMTGASWRSSKGNLFFGFWPDSCSKQSFLTLAVSTLTMTPPRWFLYNAMKYRYSNTSIQMNKVSSFFEEVGFPTKGKTQQNL